MTAWLNSSASSRRHSAKLALASLMTVSVVTLVAFTARAWRTTTSSDSLSASATSINVAQSPSPEPRGQAQIVHFTLYDLGIFPREARANPGLVAIYINDLSGGTQGLIVERESGQRVGQVMPKPDRARGRSRIAVGRGIYRVYDASRPANRATLIVEPH